MEVSGGSYNGLFVDLLSKISKDIDVDIEIKTTTGPSYKTDDGHWRGVVRKVTERVYNNHSVILLTYTLFVEF